MTSFANGSTHFLSLSYYQAGDHTLLRSIQKKKKCSGKVYVSSAPPQSKSRKLPGEGTWWYLTGIPARSQENAGIEEVGGKFPETQYRAGKDTNLQSQRQFKLAQSTPKSVSEWVCECVRELRQSI